MGERKRSLRPLETLKKEEREHLYKQTHAEVQSYHYESQTIRLLKKEKKQREIEEQLAEKIIEFKRKSQEIEENSKKLKKDKEEAKVLFDGRKGVITAYDHRVKTEDDKLKKESLIIRDKDLEISEKIKDREIEKRNLEEIERKIESYSIYKKILDEVVNKSEDYEEISQLILRCRTLKNSVNHLSQSYRKLEADTDKEKEYFFTEMNKLNEDISVYTGDIHNLESKIETLTNSINFIQSKQELQRISRIEHKAEIAKIELSIKNLYSKAMQSKPSLNANKSKGEEERKIRVENLKGTKNDNNEKEVEDPSILISMIQKIRERYTDLKIISSTVEDEVVASKPIIVRSPGLEEHSSKSKLMKKATIGKNSIKY